MAGGQGTRLRPLTSNLPKPMVPVVNKPTAQHIVELLARHEIRDIVMTVAFMPQLIQNYFGDGSSFGVNIEYSVEDSPLGTAGSVKKAEPLLDDTFLVISGDSLTDFDLGDLIAFHRERDAMVTIALKSVDNPLEFGVVIVDEHGRIDRFLEKPGWGQVFSDTINTGIYVLEPEVLDHVPKGAAFDFSHELFPRLYDLHKPLFGRLSDGYWQDIGSLSQYLQANRDALDGRVRARIPGVRLRGNVWVGQGVDFETIDHIQGPALIGDYARIAEDSRIGAHTVLGNNVVVRNGASVAGSVIGDGSYVGPGSRIRGAVIGSGVDIRANATVSEGAVIGESSSVGEQAVIGGNVKVYPSKVIEAGASIRSSLIWETRGQSSLFGKEGIRGLINVDITPELVLRLAMAYGTTLPEGSIVTTSRDHHPATRVLNRALTAGLNATGVTVRDLRITPNSLTRFDLKEGNSAGGVHIRLCPEDPEQAEIILSERPGIPMSPRRERAIENVFYREDYRRSAPDEMGMIIFPARLMETYLHALLEVGDVERLRSRGLRVVLDQGGASAALLVASALDELSLDVINVSTSEARSTSVSSPDSGERAEKMRRYVTAMQSDVGVLFDAAAEAITVFDETGARVPDEALLMLVARHACVRHGPGDLAVPAHVTHHVEEVVGGCGGTVIRTKVAEEALLVEALSNHAVFAGSVGGRFIIPSFLPSPDGLMSFLLVLELLSDREAPLSQLVEDLPSVTVASRTVECPWSLKGAVMRRLVEETKQGDVSLLDGVKVLISPSEWVHYLPDPGLPLFRVYAEAETQGATEELLAAHVDRLAAIVEDVRPSEV
jgi:mannose-1-phosphate guanylyltransferase/phosphomannomutase